MTDAHHPDAGEHPSGSKRRGGSAPPRWQTLALAAGMLVVAVGGIVAFSGYDMMVGRLPLVLAAVWCTLLVAVLVLAIGFRRRRALAAFGAISMSVLVVGVLGLPMTARAALSESQLAAASEQVRAGESVGRAGLYWPGFSWYDEEAQCAFFETQGVFISSYGVAYCTGDDSYLDHLSGNVYMWEMD